MTCSKSHQELQKAGIRTRTLLLPFWGVFTVSLSLLKHLPRSLQELPPPQSLGLFLPVLEYPNFLLRKKPFSPPQLL